MRSKENEGKRLLSDLQFPQWHLFAPVGVFLDVSRKETTKELTV